MKEITLEDIKQEINDNLWRVTILEGATLTYNSNCYVKITENQIEAVVVIDNKAAIIWSKNIKNINDKLLSTLVIKYVNCKIDTIDFIGTLRIEKQKMNKEIFDLIVTATELPF